MNNPRIAEGDAFSTSLFSSRFRGQLHQPGDGDPDFNDGLLTPRSPMQASGMEVGYVVAAYPSTMTVDIETDTGPHSGCRIGSSYISPLGAGYSVVPEPGTCCLVCTSVTPAVVICAIAEADAADTAQDGSKIDAITTGAKGYGGQDPTYSGQGGTNHRSGRTDQLIPGDQVFSAPEGNLVGILRGLTVLKGSELSQILLTNLGGLVRLVSNIYEHFHAAGITQISNQDGKTSVVFSVGSTARDNGEVEPTVHLTVGALGDLVELRITTEDGEQLARAHIDSQGNVELETNDCDIEVNKDADITVDGDASMAVEGSLTHAIGGEFTEECAGKRELKANELNLQSGGNSRLQAGGDLNLSTGGRYTMQAAGDSTLQTGKYTHETLLGEMSWAVKAPGLRLAGLKLTRTGDIDMTSLKSATLGGKVRTALTGASIQLGDGAGLPVIRNTDLGPLVDAIFAYINATGVVAGPKITIPAFPGPVNPVSAVIAAIGSKIVKAS